MSLNIIELDENGNKILKKVAGNSDIVDTAIETDSTWSSEKINTNLGDLSKLETEAKTDLVSAINEAKESGGGASIDDETTSKDSTWSSQKISETTGNLGSLATLDKSNLVSAINEIALNVGASRFLYRNGEELCNYETSNGIKYASTIELDNSAEYNIVYATKSIDLSSYDYITFIGRYKTSGSSSWKDINTRSFNIQSYNGRYFVNVCFYKGSMYAKSGIYFGLTDKVTKAGSMSSIKIYEESNISAVRIDQIYLSN